MSNYKLEVENTEKLKNDIDLAFTEINTELEKDDNLIASDLFDVDKKIEELKKSRKKWASGKIVNMGASEIKVSSLNLDFEPTILSYSYVTTANDSWVLNYKGLEIINDSIKSGIRIVVEKSGPPKVVKYYDGESFSGNINDISIPEGPWGISGISEIERLTWLAFE